MRIEADCVWREPRVIVELDGRAARDRSLSFESGRLRDRLLLVRGWRPTRVTWQYLHSEPDRLDADVRSLLGSAGPLRAR